MECTCHLMRGEPCPTCNENARRQLVQDKRLDRINNCESIVDLERLVTRFAMVFMPNSHKNILKMDWMGAAHEVMDEQPEYAQLLVAAAERWQVIEMGLDKETPDEESVVYDLRAANADKAKRHAMAYGMGPDAFKRAYGVSAQKMNEFYQDRLTAPKDPDGPPSGAFLNQQDRLQQAAWADAAVLASKRAKSLRFINQPAKSLREELRMGVNYEDRPE